MMGIDAALAIVFRAETILICQRKADDVLGGYWEFPGGKRETGESLEQCLHRELQEELAIRATPVSALTPFQFTYPHGHIRFHPFICRHESGEPQLLECQATEWIDPPRLREFQFPPANDALLSEVIAWFASRTQAGC